MGIVYIMTGATAYSSSPALSSPFIKEGKSETGNVFRYIYIHGVGEVFGYC